MRQGFFLLELEHWKHKYCKFCELLLTHVSPRPTPIPTTFCVHRRYLPTCRPYPEGFRTTTHKDCTLSATPGGLSVAPVTPTRPTTPEVSRPSSNGYQKAGPGGAGDASRGASPPPAFRSAGPLTTRRGVLPTVAPGLNPGTLVVPVPAGRTGGTRGPGLVSGPCPRHIFTGVSRYR